jgi:hypothetical protein
MAEPRSFDIKINGMPYVFAHAWAERHSTKANKSLEDEAKIPIQRPDHEVGAYLGRESSDWYVESYRNFQDGAGQRSLDHAAANRSRFVDSRSIDGSRQAEMRLAAATSTLTGVAGRTPTAVACEGMGRLWCVWRDAYGHDALYYYDQATDAWYGAPNSSVYPYDGGISAICSDGDWVYFAVTGSLSVNGVFKVRAGTSTVKISDVQSISAMAVCMGYLCVARDGVAGENPIPNGSSAGYLDFTAEPGRAYVACTPSETSVWMPNLVTEDLVALDDNFVYWLVRSGEGATIGEESRIYKFNPTAEGYAFGSAATFPTGFTAECLCGYLGRLFCGGYEKTPTVDNSAVSSSGMGEIYSLTPGETWERVVHIGEEELADSRIWSITAYERFIYFLAGSQLYRYSIVEGGYEHVGALASGVETAYWTDLPPASWTLTWDATGEPPASNWVREDSTNPAPDTHVECSGGLAYVRCENNAWSMWRHADPALTGDGMLEFAIQGIVSDGGMHGIGNSSAALVVRTVAGTVFEGNTYCYLYVRRRRNKIYEWDHVGTFPDWRANEKDAGHLVTIRLQLDDTAKAGYIYVNGELQRSIAYAELSLGQPVFWTTIPLANSVFFSVGSPRTDQTREKERIYFSYLRYNRGTLYDPPPTTMVGDSAKLIARYGSVFAAVSGAGCYRTSRYNERGYATEGWLRLSDSSMGIDGVKKYLRYTDVLHAPLGFDEEIRITTYIDGAPYETFVLNQAACGGERLSSLSLPTGFGTKLAIDAYTVGAKVELRGPGTSTPVVYAVVLRGTLETVRRYIYILNCYDLTPDSSGSGVDQPYSGQVLLANLRQIRGRAVEFESRIEGTFVGKIEQLELHHGIDTDGSESEYQGVVVVQVREL